MSTWVSVTVDDVLSEFTPSELATITAMMGGQPLDNTSKLAQVLARTISEIRGYISSGDYPLDPDSETTLPPSLVVDAISISRWRFLISVPQLKQLQTQERYQSNLDSIKKLQSISQQQYNVERPTASTTSRFGMWNSENKIIMRTHPTPAPSTQFQIQQNQPAYANPDAPADG